MSSHLPGPSHEDDPSGRGLVLALCLTLTASVALVVLVIVAAIHQWATALIVLALIVLTGAIAGVLAASDSVAHMDDHRPVDRGLGRHL